MTIRFAGVPALVLLAALPVAQQPRPGPTPAERAAWQAWDRGDTAAAALAFAGMVEDAGHDALAAGRAEAHAVLANDLSRRLLDRSAVIAVLDRAYRRSDLQPFLRDGVGTILLEDALLRGDRQRALELTRALGVITDWQVLGPLDNERGTGFQRRRELERHLDLSEPVDGKERTVLWRRWPVPELPSGTIDLGAVMRPDEQVMAYAATNLHADEPTTAVLHLGSGGSVAVFLEGTELFRRDVRRPCHPDQDAVALPLRAGDNLLLLAVGTRESGLRFTARLRAPDGTPITGISTDGSAPAVGAAAADNAAVEALPPPERGGVTALAANAERDPADALRLGVLLADRMPDDPARRRDQELAARAVEGLPDLPVARHLLAATLRRHDADAAEREDNRRMALYRRILADHPDHVPARRELGRLLLDTVGSGHRAEEILRRALEVAPDAGDCRVALAAALDHQDLDSLARRQRRLAARPGKDGHRRREAVYRCARDLIDADRLHEAVRPYELLLAHDHTPDRVMEAVDLLLRTGARARAVALLEDARALFPLDPRPIRRHARLREGEGRPEDALELVDRWLLLAPDDADALVLSSRLHRQANQPEAQREALAAALEREPNRRSEARYLEFLAEDSEPFYTAFRIDAGEVLAADPGPFPGAEDAGDPWYHLLDHRVVRSWRNGTSSDYRHHILRILTDEGARRMRRYVVRHHRGEQRARLLTAKVVRPDGTVGQPRLRGAGVELPNLHPGDAVVLESRVDDLAPSFFGPMFNLEHVFRPRDGAPSWRARLDVIADADRELFTQADNGAPEPEVATGEGGSRHWRVEMRELPRRDMEPYRPGRAETAPLVRFTTWRDWEHFGNWWWNLIRGQIEVTPAMRDKVLELTAGLGTTEEKIAAVYRFVTTDVRYEAWEFGVHGYQPYSTAVIHERRHGDCKDKALLLHAMLGTLGIECWPVLIQADRTRTEDDLTLPLVGHFNHCISYLPPRDGEPGRFLDGTARWHPMDTLPAMDQGAEVLLVTADGVRLMETPYVGPGANVDSGRFTFELAGDGSARGRWSLRPTGNRAVNVRSWLGSEEGQWEAEIERHLTARLGPTEVDDIRTSDLHDLGAPVTVDCRLRCEAAARRQGGNLLVDGDVGDLELSRWTAEPERRHDVLLGIPRREHQRVVWHVPDGRVPVRLPPEVGHEVPAARFHAAWSFADGTLTLERSLELRAPRVEAGDYDAFRDFAERVARADARVVVLHRGEER